MSEYIDVAALKCPGYGNREVYEAINKALRLLGGMERFVKKGERILLKPNMLAGKPPEAAVTTHPEVVEAVVRHVKEAGATPVVGDSPGIGNPRKTAEKCGILDVCTRTGAEFMELKELIVAENPAGHTFKRLEVAKEVLSVDGIINLPKLKTHAQMYLTLGVKNLFGCVPGKRKPQWHLTAGVDSLYFAGMLLDLYTFLDPRLTIMDGIVGMEGNGPGSGRPRNLGLVFASVDAVAMDTLVTDILGASAYDLPILKAAKGRGLKGAELKNIYVLGEEPSALKVHGFDFPPLISLNFADRLPYFIGKKLSKALTSRPHIKSSVCTLCNVCVEVCPAEVMEKTERININYDSCIRCYCCQEMCPHGAIASRDGWIKWLVPGL